MPSQAQPSLRDGRPLLPPGKDYYSNKDIELLYDVICKGEDLLPTLPRRDRLPTNALFHAADQIFPLYDLDPATEDRLSRFLFLIGGMRTTDDLRERFRTVLARMGIELEVIERSPVDHESENNEDAVDDQDDQEEPSLPDNVQHHRRSRLSYLNASPPSPRPAPPRSVRTAVSSAYSAAQTGAFPVAPRVTGRRRRNSDSNAQFVATADAHRPDHGHLGSFEGHEEEEETADGVGEAEVQLPRRQQRRQQPAQHRRRRSDSVAPPRRHKKPRQDRDQDQDQYEAPPRSHAQHTHAPASIDPWLSQIPTFPHAPEEEADQAMTESSNHDYDEEDPEEADEDEEDAYHSEHEDDYDHDDHEHDAHDGLDEYTRSLQLLRPPARQENYHDHGMSPPQHHHHHHHHHHHALPLRSRPVKVLSQQQQQQRNSKPASIPTTAPSTGSSPQSHISPVSGVAEFYGASDTTVQDEVETNGPLPKVDLAIMSKVANTFFWKFAFQRGQSIPRWRYQTAVRQEQAQYAEQMDRELVASEALLVWADKAGTHLQDVTETREFEEEEEGEEEADDVERQRQEVEQEEQEVPEEGPAIEQEIVSAVDPSVEQPAPDVDADAEVDVDEAVDEDVVSEDVTGSDKTDEATAQARRKDEERRQLMRWAAKADEIRLKSMVLVQWQSMAQDEVERTAVARRHLLRRKVFDAWRDQAAAADDDGDARADSLAKRWALGRWKDALQHARNEDALVARPLYRRSLAIDACFTWHRTHQQRTADALREQWPRVAAVRQWRACTATALDLSRDAARRDVLALRHTAVDVWDDQARTHRVYNLRIDESNCETHYNVAVQAWTQAVFYETRLRAFLAARAAETKAEALAVWQTRAAVLRAQDARVTRDVTKKHAMHWWRVMKLKQCVAADEHRQKTESLRFWQASARFAALQRARDARLAQDACARWTSAFQQSQQADHRRLQTAVQLDRQRLVAGLCAPAVRAQSAAHAAQQQTADALVAGARAQAGLQALAAGVARHRQMGVLARRGAYYVTVVNALDGWAAYAKAVRQERLRRTYHAFRRTVKRQTAGGCVGVWVEALGRLKKHDGPAGDANLEEKATQLRQKHTEETVVTTLNRWIGATNDTLFRTAVAAEADAEVYLSKWRLRTADAAAWGAAAAEHDAAVQLAGRWDDWELQAVQARARAHTAEALHEKNDRRLGRRALTVWQQMVEERARDDGGGGRYGRMYGDGGYDFDHDHDHDYDNRRLFQSTGSTGSRWRSAPSPPPLGRTIGPGARRPAASASALVSASTTPAYQHTADPPYSVARRPAASLLLHPITEYTGSQRSSVAGLDARAQPPKRPRTTFSTPMAPVPQRPTGGSNSVPAPPGGRLAAMTPAARGAGQPRRLYRSTTTTAAPAPWPVTTTTTTTTTPAPPRVHAPLPASAQTSSSLFRVAPLSVSTASYVPPAPSPGPGPGPGRRRRTSVSRRDGERAQTAAAPRTTAESARPHQSLHERLRSAARLADSVQLGPALEGGGGGVGGHQSHHTRRLSDDGDDDGHDPDDDDDDDDEDGSSPRVLRRPQKVALSSRKRRETTQRPPPASQSQLQAGPPLLPWMRRPSHNTPVPGGGGGGSSALSSSNRSAVRFAPAPDTTTTPSAPLPTPFARRLRAAYGGGGGGGGGGGRQKSRLAVATEFSDDDDDNDNDDDRPKEPISPEALLRSPGSSRSPVSPRTARVVVTSPRVVSFAERMAEGRRRGGGHG